MVDARLIEALINARANQILSYAELAIADDRILERFRTLVLDALGHKGLRTDLAELLDHGGQGGRDRHGHGPETRPARKGVRHG